MSREQESEFEEEEQEEETDEDEETPAPVVVKKPMVKKPIAAPPSKPAAKPSAPQVQLVRVPVFESQAMQCLYDLLLDMNHKLDKQNADLELMKKYLPQE